MRSATLGHLATCAENAIVNCKTPPFSQQPLPRQKPGETVARGTAFAWQPTIDQTAKGTRRRRTISAWRSTLEAGAEQALRSLGESSIDQVPVVDHGKVLGVVAARDLVKWISLQQDEAA